MRPILKGPGPFLTTLIWRRTAAVLLNEECIDCPVSTGSTASRRPPAWPTSHRVTARTARPPTDKMPSSVRLGAGQVGASGSLLWTM